MRLGMQYVMDVFHRETEAILGNVHQETRILFARFPPPLLLPLPISLLYIPSLPPSLHVLPDNAHPPPARRPPVAPAARRARPQRAAGRRRGGGRCLGAAT